MEAQNENIPLKTFDEFADLAGKLKGLGLPKISEGLKDQLKVAEKEEDFKKMSKNHKKTARDLQKILDDPTLTPDERIKQLSTFAAAQIKSNKVVLRSMQTNQSDNEKYTRDSDFLRAENEKNISQIQKLEKLSKHFQTEQENIIEEHKKLVDAEQARRQEYAKELQKNLDEVHKALEEATRTTLHETEKKKWLADKDEEIKKHFEERSVLFDTEFSKKESEIKSYHDKVTEKLQILENEAKACTEVKELYEKAELNDKDLATKLETYMKKGEEFHVVVSKTNELLNNLKKRMEKLGKQIRTTEQDNKSIQAKCEKEDLAFLSSFKEIAKTENEIKLIKAQEANLVKLEGAIRDNLAKASAELAELKTQVPAQQPAPVAPGKTA